MRKALGSPGDRRSANSSAAEQGQLRTALDHRFELHSSPTELKATKEYPPKILTDEEEIDMESLNDMKATHYKEDMRRITTELKGELFSMLGIGMIGRSVGGMGRLFPAFEHFKRNSADILQMGADWISDE
jgi:hypothetical protein